MQLPHLTTEFPGIGGAIKQRAEDFFVQELPLYEPSGQGEHVYCEIEKIGLTTFDAINQISGALGVSSREIGYAGMKDARAISRQLLSIRGANETDVMALKLPDISVKWAARHGNKLRLGHLAGNRFAIKIRDVNPIDVIKLRPMLAVLEKRGMPNYFGEQRFGRRGNNHEFGAALVREDDAALLKLMLGSPDAGLDDPPSRAAREAYEAGDLEKSMKLWPRRAGMERRILARLIKTKRPAAAVRAIDEKLRRLWVSALQSKVFNDVLAARIGAIDRVLVGDVAYKHENGACFTVEDAAIEQPRCEAFEISATGPLVGYRVTMPVAEPLAIEEREFLANGVKPNDFRREGRLRVKGARRPLRVKPQDVQIEGGVDEHGAHITVAFTLPAGSYATVLLGELMKTEAPDQAGMTSRD
jgi:tRNA pseudouridine13 synthase